MKNQIERIRHSFQEVREMHSLIESEINEILTILSNNKHTKFLKNNEVENIFGKFEYKEIAGGRIRIIDNWRNDNIKLLRVGTTEVWVHKLIFPQTAYVFAKIYAEGLQDELDLTGGGGFCARHISWNPANPLSFHAYGGAIDFNPLKYPYGGDNKPPARVIEIFKEGGFAWGGDFSVRVTKDNMHFEFNHFLI